MNANNYEQRWLDLNSQKLGTDTVILFHRGMLYCVYLWFWKTFSYFNVFRSMFLFLRKYGVEMSRAESPVSSYIPAPTWPRRIGGAESAAPSCPIPCITRLVVYSLSMITHVYWTFPSVLCRCWYSQVKSSQVNNDTNHGICRLARKACCRNPWGFSEEHQPNRD